jgi:hypothetical protein
MNTGTMSSIPQLLTTETQRTQRMQRIQGQPEAVRGSPLDVPAVKLKLTRDEVVDFVREGRRPA